MNRIKPYDGDLSLVKALISENDKLIIGHYSQVKDPNSEKTLHYVKEPTNPNFYEVNPYAICRNSGIKDKDGKFIFEYDLLKISNYFNQDEQYGFLVWEDFYKAWKIRRFTEFGGTCDVSKFKVETVGNILLCDADAEIIYKQDKAEKEREAIIDTSYCPSCFKK